MTRIIGVFGLLFTGTVIIHYRLLSSVTICYHYPHLPTKSSRNIMLLSSSIIRPAPVTTRGKLASHADPWPRRSLLGPKPRQLRQLVERCLLHSTRRLACVDCVVCPRKRSSRRAPQGHTEIRRIGKDWFHVFHYQIIRTKT